LRPDEILPGLQLRDGSGGPHVTNNAYFDNLVRLDLAQARELVADPGCEPDPSGSLSTLEFPDVRPQGQKQPVGSRAHLRGRQRIILDEWGPWDHESTMVRLGSRQSNGLVYDLFGFAIKPAVRILTGSVTADLEGDGLQRQLRVSASPGVHTFRIELDTGEQRRELTGTLVCARWRASFFAWSTDPREDLEGWRKLAEGPGARVVSLDRLELAYGWNGPRQMKLSPELTAQGPGPDHFGMIARARIELPAGRWRFSTLSDDGVRVRVDRQTIIENWTWHGPTRDSAGFQQRETREVDLVIEHFEIDGYAVLQFDLEPVHGP
jgi:hypothetical protein